MNEYIPVLIALARKVGVAILDMYYKSSQFDVQAKPDATPLTQADILANEVLMSGLKNITPQLPIISEEETETPFIERQKWKCYWLIDPVDGTKEFIRHSGEFAVNIALIDQHIPILGLIYLPVLDLVYYAVQGKGAYKLSEGRLQKLQVRTLTADAKITIATGHRHKLEKLQSFLQHFPQYEVISAGSAYKFCLIAEGKADIYPRFGPTSEWDTAAGQVILEEAGGQVLDLEWQPLRYNTKAALLNPHFLALGDVQRLSDYIRRKS